MSQLDTAIAAEIKQYRFWRIENGYDKPTPDEKAALARVLGVAESVLFPASDAERREAEERRTRDEAAAEERRSQEDRRRVADRRAVTPVTRATS